MLDTATKRRIDTARDILVGKVPDPKSQVEQITIALIYKFMDDMDAEAEEMGGHRKFFAAEFGRYGWAKLMRSGLGGFEVLNLYAEAISRMTENPGIPPLFRDIFKNAYLPYRDPETLKSFLKIIDEFNYDHSERLGDAFEYLLSVLGSQGDAGQFRTPRHIIDFIVAVVDPKKNETILDPACGTAGFLVSSYKHIVRANTNARGQVTLTPDERGRLAHNIHGYDISPDMVRLSLVNLYLHGFADPHIDEYDTLTSEDKWNEYADVILANPPFMSPKGGIKPHRRFSVQSNRSEVLFVDYMAEHLTPTGRAGIIVPEGIIFQSQNAYVDLRKMLVENYLVAVISLPSGVFNPYSGVKTCILILDKSLARQSSTIAFFKVENDGYGLGAQRRAVGGSELAQVAVELIQYLNAVRSKQPTDKLHPLLGLIVRKDRIAGNGDYNLSGERYREVGNRSHHFPLVSLGETDLFRIDSGGTPKSDVEEYWGGKIAWATLIDLPASDFISEIRATARTITERGLAESSAKIIPENSVIVSTRATIGRIGINRIPMATNQGFKNVVIVNSGRAIPEYVALAITRLVPTMEAWATGGTFKEISKSKFCELRIPLPPLQVQKEIVAEIEGYQKVINGARAVVENYRPHIPVDPEWPMVRIDDLCELGRGRVISQQDISANRGPYPVYSSQTSDDGVFGYLGTYDFEGEYVTWTTDGANAGTVFHRTGKFNCTNVCGTLKCRSDAVSRVDMRFLAQALGQVSKPYVVQVGNPKLMNKEVARIVIPLPPFALQQAFATEIEAEQALVGASRELIARFEKKIQATIARVWGEDERIPLRSQDTTPDLAIRGAFLGDSTRMGSR